MNFIVVLFFTLLFSCSHGGKKISMKTDELLRYVENREKIKKCSQYKKTKFFKKKQSDYWNKVGICHFLEGDYNKAIFYLDISLKKTKKNPSAETLNNLGVINLHFKRYRRAYVFLKKALESKPNDLIVNTNLAHLYIKFRRYEAAEKLVNKLIAKNIKNLNLKKILNRIKKMKRRRG